MADDVPAGEGEVEALENIANLNRSRDQLQEMARSALAALKEKGL